MRYLKFCFFAMILLLAGLGCSDSDQTSVPDQPSQPASVPEPAVPMEKVVPVQLSSEDREKAKLAPEGMVFIKGGCFIMGNNYAQEDEYPEHQVCVDDFYLDKYEVTQERWEKVMKFNPSRFPNKDHPLEQINYYEVRRFVEKSGGRCRLPTEAEWEYAARGEVDSRYYWGNMMEDDYAWYEDNSAATTHPVGEKKPNQYGLHDMMGNVWEWTDDWYKEIYDADENKNPRGPASGQYKVIRGGAFDSSGGALRATNRTWIHPKNRVFPKVTSYGQVINEIFNYIGFRCAKSLPEETPLNTVHK